nr:MAG TPA: hypothetical protein [Caudoviricetes sp.]
MKKLRICDFSQALCHNVERGKFISSFVQGNIIKLC